MEPSTKSAVLPRIARTVFAFVALLVLVKVFWLLGFAVVAFVSSQSGYRKRTAVLALIPYVQWAFLGVICWRFMSENVTWAPRMDRPSSTIYTFLAGVGDNSGLHPFNDPMSYGQPAGEFAPVVQAAPVASVRPAGFPQPIMDLRTGNPPACRGR